MAKTTTFSKRRRKVRPRSPIRIGRTLLVLALVSFLVVACAWLLHSSSSAYSISQLRKSASPPPPQLLSRRGNVKITADVRGNLGPATVLNQDPPGKDWIKDRWQAAADMHGTAIKGAHWLMMEFGSPVKASYIVLDWEAAFSKDYQIEIQNTNPQTNDHEWNVVFDSSQDAYESHEFGLSPGVKQKIPLHIVHNITVATETSSFTRLRVWIRSSAMGWGVSLWQVDVYGWDQ